MTLVRPFEADLLHVLHAILGRGPVDRAAALIERATPAPSCLSRDALRLIEETIALGVVRRLARDDGWRVERHCRGDGVVDGRLWRRHPPSELGLNFTGQSLEFLIRLTEGKLTDLKLDAGALSLGDRLLLFLAYAAFRPTNHRSKIGDRPYIRKHGLCRLAFPADFHRHERPHEVELEVWFDPGRAWVLESLQGTLAQSWVDSERLKWDGDNPRHIVEVGQEQGRVIAAACDSAERTGRWDLLRFFPKVARELLRDPTRLRERLQAPKLKELRLADRAEIARSALAALQALDRFEKREREARSVGYFDEGYPAAQLMKADWERLGCEGLHAEGRSLLRALDPLGMATPSET